MGFVVKIVGASADEPRWIGTATRLGPKRPVRRPDAKVFPTREEAESEIENFAPLLPGNSIFEIEDEHLKTPSVPAGTAIGVDSHPSSVINSSQFGTPFTGSSGTGHATTIDAAGEEFQQFDAALNRMPAEYQAAIELRNFKIMSFTEIGDVLDCSADAARQLWIKAFAQLQKELGLSKTEGKPESPGTDLQIEAALADLPIDSPPCLRSENGPGDATATFPPSDAGLREKMAPAKECLDLIERIRRSRECALSASPLDSMFALLDEKPSDSAGLSHRLGRFEVVRELGRGGHGVVFQAHDPALKRDIALKIPRPELLLSKSMRRRFVDEAQTVARLDHPNIIRVFEAGFDGRVCYIVQELCEGPSLATWLRQRSEPVEPEIAAWIIMKLAKALVHAHRLAILHRDLKPANVLLKPLNGDRGGNGRDSADLAAEKKPAAGDRVCESFSFTPKLCDFGICKAFDDDGGRTITRSGVVVGTAAYMAPEQAAGKASETGPMTDVYGLGAILYELLTGSPPIQGNSQVDILRRVLTDVPISIRRNRPNVPADLELVCLKCLAKEPTQRYATADLLAADLERFLAGEPVTARKVPAWELAWIWTRRYPLRAASVLLIAVMFCVWIGTVTATNVWLGHLNKRLKTVNNLLVSANREKQAAAVHSHEMQLAAERQKMKADELLYVADMQHAGSALRSGDMRRLVSLLERHRPRGQPEPFEGGEWNFLWRQGQMAHHVIDQGRKAIYFVCLAPDERHLATAGKDAVIRLYDIDTPKLLLSFDSHQLETNGIAFSPDGATLASAGDDGTVALWRIDWKQLKVKLLRSIKAHATLAFNVLFTLDGKTLISAGRDKVIRLWDVATGRSVGVLEGHRDTSGSIALHPNGKWVASGCHDGEIIIWDIRTRTIAHRVQAGNTPVLSIDFSRDGTLLAAGTSEHDIRIWKVPSWEFANKIDLLDQAQRIDFMPDGQSILVGDSAGTVHQCPTGVNGSATGPASPTRRRARAWKAHVGQIDSIVLSHRARQLITGGRDGAVVAWNLGDREYFKDLRDPHIDFEGIQFVAENTGSTETAGSNRLAVSDGHTISLWDPESLTRTRVLGHSDGNLLCLSASRDGSMLAAGGMNGVLRLYHLRELGRESRWNLGKTFNVHRVAVSPDGRLAAAIDRFNSEKHDDLYVIDTVTGKRLEHIRARTSNSAAFSPDGHWLFASGPSNVVMVWDVRTQKKIAEMPGHGSSINCIQFAPRSPWVATAGDDRLIKIWSTENWKLKFTLEGAHRPVHCLAISADGRTMASSEKEGTLTLWHTSNEEDLFQPMIEVDASPVYPERISFSPDDQMMAYVLNNPGSTSSRHFVRIVKWRTAKNGSVAQQ